MKDDLDEPMLHRADSETARDMLSVSTEEQIQRLAQRQLYGVLCTQANGIPYGSVVAFAFSDDLNLFAFATAKRKYKLMRSVHMTH